MSGIALSRFSNHRLTAHAPIRGTTTTRKRRMKPRLHIVLGLVAGAWFGAAAATPPPQAKDTMIMHATGTFDIKLNPQTVDNAEAQAANLARLSFDKQFHGALDATGKGEMLASGDGTQSGAYVAIEKISGSLQGRTGGFMLTHSAVMNRGVPENWSIVVVPDSGTGQLTGLGGTMKITIVDGKHFYELDYTLPKS